MNALDIPELRGRNPGSGHRCVFRAEMKPTWKKILAVLMERFPEIESVVFARVKPGALERSAFSPFLLMAFYLDEYSPVRRLRELELALIRLFYLEEEKIRFAAGRGSSQALFPITELMERVREKGALVYKRARAPRISPRELLAIQLMNSAA